LVLDLDNTLLHSVSYSKFHPQEFRSIHGLCEKSEMEIYPIIIPAPHCDYYSDGDRVYLITFPPKAKSARRLQKEREKDEKRRKKAERDSQRTNKRDLEISLFLKMEQILLHSIQSMSNNNNNNNNNNQLIEEKKKLEKVREREMKASKHYEDKQKKQKLKMEKKKIEKERKLHEKIEKERKRSRLLKFRPCVFDFLKKISLLYEVSLYTLGTKAYADQAVMAMEQACGPIFQGRVIAREDNPALCSSKKVLPGHMFNPLSTIILDDNKSKVWDDTSNLLTIQPYSFFVSGRTLELHYYIESLSVSSDTASSPSSFSHVLKILQNIEERYMESTLNNSGNTDIDIRQLLRHQIHLHNNNHENTFLHLDSSTVHTPINKNTNNDNNNNNNNSDINPYESSRPIPIRQNIRSLLESNQTHINNNNSEGSGNANQSASHSEFLSLSPSSMSPSVHTKFSLVTATLDRLLVS